jgi:sigma-B regulation protein RsbU (phosphoserine phosphatase)
MRILVAEDERISRRTLTRTLERWGHDVVSAEDGEAAFEAFEQGAFDMVVTDWEMPRMDGCELVRRIRGMEGGSYVYLMMLTGRSEKHDLIEGMEAGADDFLAKPLDRDELRVRLAAGERIIELERTLAAQNETLEAANQRMHRDLEAAARVQQELLPTTPPTGCGARFAWSYQPCDELAGDLLNVTRIDERHVAFYVADVSGHGVASALISVSVHRNLAVTNDRGSLIAAPSDQDGGLSVAPPPAVAGRLNELYPMSSNGGHFLTIAYCVLDREKRQLRYCCAGHPGPVLVRRDEPARSFDAPALPIGIIEDAEYEESVIDLQPGDRIYIYSDGVIEAKAPDDDLLGRARLEALITEVRTKSIEESIDAITAAVTDWRGGGLQDDDISLLALEIE